MGAVRDHFDAKALAAIKWLEGQPLLAAAVKAETDAFFARNAGLARTELTTGFIASLVIDRLSAPDDSQSDGASQNQNQKVA